MSNHAYWLKDLPADSRRHLLPYSFLQQQQKLVEEWVGKQAHSHLHYIVNCHMGEMLPKQHLYMELVRLKIALYLQLQLYSQSIMQQLNQLLYHVISKFKLLNLSLNNYKSCVKAKLTCLNYSQEPRTIIATYTSCAYSSIIAKWQGYVLAYRKFMNSQLCYKFVLMDIAIYHFANY